MDHRFNKYTERITIQYSIEVDYITYQSMLKTKREVIFSFFDSLLKSAFFQIEHAFKEHMEMPLSELNGRKNIMWNVRDVRVKPTEVIRKIKYELAFPKDQGYCVLCDSYWNISKKQCPIHKADLINTTDKAKELVNNWKRGFRPISKTI